MAVLALWIFLAGNTVADQNELRAQAKAALELIRQQHYNTAISQLEQLLESAPGDSELLSYLGAAYLYGERDFVRAKKLFEESFRAGGGAVFYVLHSHEVMGSSELADYCRGWLFLRKGFVEFKAEDGGHSFRLSPPQILEMKQNRLAGTIFHLQYQKQTQTSRPEKKNYNFGPRTGDERETLLILALYQKFVI